MAEETPQPAAEEPVAADTPAAEEETPAQEPAAETGEETGEQPEPEAAAVEEKPAKESPKETVAVKDKPKPDEKPGKKPKAKAAPVAKEAKLGPAEPAERPKPPSPEPPAALKAPGKGADINLEATATVKFVLMPSGQVVTMACMLGQTLQQLKIQFANELKMPINLIMLMFDGKTMSDATTLADLGVGPNGTVQLEMQSADPVNNPIRSYRPRQEYQMPDVITVRVQTERDAKDVVVEIERATSKKPFLGGFRHKVNGAEFHNAAAQTSQKARTQSGVDRYCRDTQTVQQLHQVQQTFNDTSTQMTGVGVYVCNLEDKLMVPGKYTLADDHLFSILQKVILIQKYYRRWLAKRYVNKLKEDKRRRLEWERLEEVRKQKEKEDRIKLEFQRRMHPKSKEDFDLLYAALEKWRLEELERINSSLTGAERKAALCMLLDQETQLLAAIERHKLETGVDNKHNRIQDFLEKAAAPKKWRGFDGKPTEMDTPYTLRAKELRDIYNSINMKYLTQDERLDVLLTLKHTVKEHDCKLTQEIIELIDREADLLMRGVKESNLTGLRKRISTLFLQYIKTPTFNPEAAHLLKVPQDPSSLRKNIYFCSSCNKYLASTEFYLSSNSRTPGKCRSCLKIDNDARIRQDYSHYRRMLKALRRSEESYNDNSQIAFLMQESDLHYLVENIWSGQSVLSAWQDLYDLVLVRWDQHAQWSPWNCILLTQDEAKSHQHLVTLDEGYGEVFIHKVTQKHTLARNYFSRLPGMAELIRQHGADTAHSMAPGPSTIAGRALNMQSQKV
ncbi:IQ motif and ubiquitin-like domain-containing protein [Littorina saxatilis]|uniref:Ubiquitin-like domain-containing protein n=1 Tax=Littorina saxatilis TaxID=31220 RepID=A0AAN9BB69_9CAEN